MGAWSSAANSACPGTFSGECVTEHHGFYQHGDLHVALGAQRRRARIGRSAAHPPRYREGDRDGRINRAHYQARMNFSVLRFERNRSGDGKMVNCNNGKCRNGECDERAHKYAPENMVEREPDDVF